MNKGHRVYLYKHGVPLHKTSTKHNQNIEFRCGHSHLHHKSPPSMHLPSPSPSSKVSFLLCCLRLWFSLVEVEIFPTKANVSNRKLEVQLWYMYIYIYAPPNSPIIVRFCGGVRSSWQEHHTNHSPGYGSNWNINSQTSCLNLTQLQIEIESIHESFRFYI